MKNQIARIIGIAVLGLAMVTPNLHAQNVSPEAKDSVISFVQGVSAEKNITVALYPSFAPDLINKDGEKDQWGAGIALTYHPQGAVGQYTFVGLRADWLGSEITLASVSGGLKADVQVFGFNFTPFAFTSATIPITGTQEDGEVGIAVGAGVKADLWKFDLSPAVHAKLSVFGAVEKWSQFDGSIFHVGPALTIWW